MTNSSHILDLLIIGGGVVGCAVLREAALAGWHVALAEAEGDVGAGISRANTAIAHTGFDAPPGTLEAGLVTASHHIFPALCQELGVATRPCGALMLALDTADVERLRAYQHKAALNGIAVEWLDGVAVLAERPYLNPAVEAALSIPGEMPLDSFALTIAYAEAAVHAGATIWLDEAVVAIEQQADVLFIRTTKREILARFVVNAAGLAAAALARMVGDHSFEIRPRKGQLIVIDPADAPPIDTILLPTPSPTTKGILITPAAHGNLLLGPTAEDLADPNDWATTQAGFDQVIAGVQRLVPTLRVEKPITVYAGLRSVGYERSGDEYIPAQDYIVRWAEHCNRLLHVAGIRSTGLSASPKLAEYVVGMLKAAGCNSPQSHREHRASIQEPSTTGLQSPAPTIVCSCSGVTAEQVRSAIHGSVPARTLDALKRRLWVMAGPCQGSRCIAELVVLLADELGCHVSEVRKHALGSEVVGYQRTNLQNRRTAEPRAENREPRTENQLSATLVIEGQTRGNLAIPGTRPAGILSAEATLRLILATDCLPGMHAVLVGPEVTATPIAAFLEQTGIAIVALTPEIREIQGWPRVTKIQDFNSRWVKCDLVVLV
jgi:glycerol-3-phosphate dehydrogenase